MFGPVRERNGHPDLVIFDCDGVLKGFEQSDVLRDVVVLMSDPPGNAGGFTVRTLNHYANTGRSRVSMRTAVDVGHQIGHSAPN